MKSTYYNYFNIKMYLIYVFINFIRYWLNMSSEYYKINILYNHITSCFRYDVIESMQKPYILTITILGYNNTLKFIIIFNNINMYSVI